MFKNCRKEDLRIVALELELIQYTIEDRKRAEEDRKRMQIEEDRKKEAENRLREKELELELARLNVNSDNERTGEGCNTLDAMVKSVRILTVKVPNRPEERKTVNRDLFALSVKRDIIKRYIIQSASQTRKRPLFHYGSLPKAQVCLYYGYRENVSHDKHTSGANVFAKNSVEEGDRRATKANSSFTKRMVLSTIARIFDPLGLLGPIITWAKIFMQRLWLLELGWSDELPFKEQKEWRRFIDSLKAVNNISIDRCIVIHTVESIKLHAFSDASEKAYGSSIYLKSISALGEVKVCLVTSESRVSPLKQISIPRLELCGAVLAAKLMKKVKEALNLQITAVHFWSDSTIVISWIHRESRELKTFVANRVSKIHQLSSRDHSGITLHQNRILQMCYLEDYFLRSFVTTLYGGMVLSFYRVLIQLLSLQNQPREMALTAN
ncbi:integrase_H2C2 domain-containing protein [Trichonephila clavipes]|nr:integrase_H2C2 domain-containing protein [Trichonephila clavipes]